MKVQTSPTSPFGRKVRMTAILKGLESGIEFVTIEAASPDNINPLAKIPSLIRDDGTVLQDSHVICEFLDAQVASPVLFPGEGDARWRALALASLADGIMDAAILIMAERRHRPEDKRVATWVERQQKKIDQALDELEAKPPEWSGHPDYGHLTLACALGYLDFRLEGKWRAGHPKLVAWLDGFAAAVPAFTETAPPPA